MHPAEPRAVAPSFAGCLWDFRVFAMVAYATLAAAAGMFRGIRHALRAGLQGFRMESQGSLAPRLGQFGTAWQCSPTAPPSDGHRSN